MRSPPPTAQIHPWIFPSWPWSRIHVDFAGPISGSMYMVVVDSYSKFLEMVNMTNTTVGTTITALIYLADMFRTMALSSLQENFQSFVLTMEFYIVHVLQQRANHPPTVSLNVLSKFLKSAIKQAQVPPTYGKEIAHSPKFTDSFS